HLWGDQAGVMRETILIPTPVGLDRSQTVSFGLPVVSAPNNNPLDRLCVAEGFFCGFDLNWPNRPFPNKDAAECPLTVDLPPQLVAFRNQNQHIDELGCLLEPPPRNPRDWSEWKFERGVLAMGVGDAPGRERLLELWIENGQSDQNQNRVVHLKWEKPGEWHNWFVVHHYNTDQSPSSGEAPGGSLDPLNIVGDPDKRIAHDRGEGTDKLDGVQDSKWSFVVEGCDPGGFLARHHCHADILP